MLTFPIWICHGSEPQTCGSNIKFGLRNQVEYKIHRNYVVSFTVRLQLVQPEQVQVQMSTQLEVLSLRRVNFF
jgi:hypothetical protein